VVIYGVHRYGWGQISEVELLTAHQVNAEDHAKTTSARWQYGMVIVSSRELDAAGDVRIMSVWKDGEKITDHGKRGAWRRVEDSPFYNGRPF
jgi:hypothetical protein